MPAPAQAGWWPPSWFKRSSGWGPPSGNSSSAAHRGGTCASTTSKLPLTALAPTPVQAVDEQALGATTAAYPTLWFYLPYTIGQSTPSTQAEKSDKTPQPFVELRLEEKNADDSAYHQRTILTMSYTQAGIIGIPLTSTSQSPLEVGKLYHWLFVIHCVPGDASANKFTRLSLLRVTPESRVPQPLEQSIPRPQRKLYTQYGLWDTVNDGVWNDFITALAALRCRSPNDATLTTLWAQSLTDVGLQSVAKQPLQCPPAVPR
ncbi:MAG: DUF928 domain-containing protein [Stenomitos rutilans HA7619-LM2]|nr:DUF928 domain-containing protein [Stenomitos rutilans HA7619-LM2]